jgi:hypothetical protein
MSHHIEIPESLCNTVPSDAQAAILTVLDSLKMRIAELEHRLNLNSTNSSRPPSSDPSAVKLVLDHNLQRLAKLRIRADQHEQDLEKIAS